MMYPLELLGVKEYMMNNDELPTGVMQDLRRHLAKPRQELADLDAQIKEVEGKLTQLKLAREQIAQHIVQYDHLLSPIRRVPVDILHNIFYYCLPTRRDPIMNARESPLLLTRICRTWRQTALASPLLWSRLYITFTDEDIIDDTQISSGMTQKCISQTLRVRCSAVEEWLSRSGACPLSISLCYTSRIWVVNAEQSPGKSDNTLELFRILARFSHRWQRLELRMPLEVYRILEGLLSTSQLPILDSLRMSLFHQVDTGLDPDNPGNGPALAVLQAPNLKRISSSSYPTTLNAVLSSPNLKNVTALSLSWMLPVTNAVTLLRHCPSLQYISLTLTSDFDEAPHPTTSDHIKSTMSIISLLHLRGISIIDATHLDTGGIYESIHAPQLEWVDYTKETGYINRNTHYPDQTTISALLQMSTKLKKLTIEANALTTSEMRKILKSAQSVTHIAFGREMRGIRHPLSTLTHPNPPSPMWNLNELFLEDGEEGSGGLTFSPRLEILEVSQGPSSTLSDETLRDFIISRLDMVVSKGIAPLKKATVIFSRVKTIDISEELSMHSKSGGNIELRLEYLNQSEVQDSWSFVSSSYGMDQHDRSWPYRDVEEEVN